MIYQCVEYCRLAVAGPHLGFLHLHVIKGGAVALLGAHLAPAHPLPCPWCLPVSIHINIFARLRCTLPVFTSPRLHITNTMATE